MQAIPRGAGNVTVFHTYVTLGTHLLVEVTQANGEHVDVYVNPEVAPTMTEWSLAGMRRIFFNFVAWNARTTPLTRNGLAFQVAHEKTIKYAIFSRLVCKMPNGLSRSRRQPLPRCRF
jgi:hypothetical protein